MSFLSACLSPPPGSPLYCLWPDAALWGSWTDRFVALCLGGFNTNSTFLGDGLRVGAEVFTTVTSLSPSPTLSASGAPCSSHGHQQALVPGRAPLTRSPADASRERSLCQVLGTDDGESTPPGLPGFRLSQGRANMADSRWGHESHTRGTGTQRGDPRGAGPRNQAGRGRPPPAKREQGPQLPPPLGGLSLTQSGPRSCLLGSGGGNGRSGRGTGGGGGGGGKQGSGRGPGP